MAHAGIMFYVVRRKGTRKVSRLSKRLPRRLLTLCSQAGAHEPCRPHDNHMHMLYISVFHRRNIMYNNCVLSVEL